MQIYKGIVGEKVFSLFQEQLGKTLMNHAFNTVNIESMLAATGVCWPTIVDNEGHVFILR